MIEKPKSCSPDKRLSDDIQRSYKEQISDIARLKKEQANLTKISDQYTDEISKLNDLLLQLSVLSDTSTYDSSKMIKHIEMASESNKGRNYDRNYASENEHYLEKSLINISSELEEFDKTPAKKTIIPSQMNDSQNMSNGENTSLEKTNITYNRLSYKKINISKKNKSIDFRHVRKPSQEDTKSIILYGGTDFSMNNSCIEDFDQFTDLKSLVSIDNKNAPNDDIDDESSFTGILEVDEEYYESNWNTERANNLQINLGLPNPHMFMNTMVNQKLSSLGLTQNKITEKLNNESTASTNDIKTIENSISSLSLNQEVSKKNQTVKINAGQGKAKIEIPRLNFTFIKPQNN